MSNIIKILENNRVTGEYHTHVSMIHPKGKFQISKHISESFWETYCDAIYEEEKIDYGIAEKPQTYIPVLVDIDIKLEYTEDKDVNKLYTDYQVENVIRNYQDVLKTILNDCKPEHLYFFLLEKPAYRIVVNDKEYIKHGFHLHAPYTFLTKHDHETHLLPRVKKNIDKDMTFKTLGFEKSGELVDKSYTRNPWLLYGSKKNEGANSYLLTKIYNEDRDVISLENALKNYKIFNADESEIDINHNYTYYLPRILSIVSWSRPVCELRPNLPSPIRIDNSMNEKKKVFRTQNLSEILSKSKKLLEIISDNRAENYADWLQIGWALFNVSEGSNEGLELWLEFSSRCQDKYDQHGCINLWEKMEKRNITIGTLHHFAKMDNPIEYNKFTEMCTKKFINEDTIANCSHNDLAKACYEKCGTDFVCASIVNNVWFQYKNHKWYRIEEGIFLRQKLSEEFVHKFQQISKDIMVQMTQNVDSQKDIYSQKIKQILKLISNLKNSSFKTNVMRECKEVFYDENFFKKLDKNAWIIGFKNGVYDLKNHIFREGIPEDYISLQMPIDYSEYDEQHYLVKEVYDFLEKIFPDREVREYFLNISSEVFVGGNQKKHVLFWSGEGDNGKSVTQTFFEKMLGEYAIKLPTSLIVGKRSMSSSASPELARAGNGVRWAILQEPDKKDIINIGILKELSGNDTFYARGLFQNGSEIEPMFKLVVICNDPPSIPHSDKATWNRIRVVPFESTFVNDAPSTFEEQLLQKRFPKDPYFMEKIPDMIKPFAWVLLNHRKKGYKFTEPQKVTLATELYRKKNDIYRQFIDERVMVDEKAKISLDEIYAVFKDWFRESQPGQQIPTKSDVKEYCIKAWGEPERRSTWLGKRYITLQDDIDKGDAIVLEQQDLVH
jgi:P4 family phage/plasmid primase-like protien